MTVVDLSRTDLNLFVVFEAVLAERHVGRAAARLNLTASAVSHSLGRLRRRFADPLFLRTPKGVTPSSRALELAPLVAEVLEAARRIVSSAAPFDPANSRRRFSVGVPDGEATVAVGDLLNAVSAAAPNLDLSIRAIMPMDALEVLDRGEVDIAVMPSMGDPPVRFHLETLFFERFVIAMRRGHPYAARPGIDAYCRQAHAVMSLTGQTHGFLDTALEAIGRSRRVVLALPSFLSILAALETTDLLAGVPASLARRYADRFGLVCVEPPFELDTSPVCAMTTRAALADAGVAWMLSVLRGLNQVGEGAALTGPAARS